MKYILMLTLKNIIHKKQRTTLTLVAVILSVTIIFTSLSIIFTIFDIANNQYNQNTGNYHYIIYQTENIPLSNHYTVTKDYDLKDDILIDNENYPLHSLNQTTIVPFYIIEGNYPSNEKEILVPEELGLNLNEKINDYKVIGIYSQSQANQLFIYTYKEYGQLYAYYIRDNYIEYSTSLEGISELLNVNKNEIVKNDGLISSDILSVYLKNPYVLYPVFIFIIFFCLIVGYITIKNVLQISDKDRKKEIGLLKSVGANGKQIKQMIQFEVITLGIIGSFIGVIIGTVFNYFLLKPLLEKLYIEVTTSILLQLDIIFISFILGCLIIYISVVNINKGYFTSMPITDLKDEVYEFPEPVKTKSFKASKFSWQMFLIYNHRLRFQTNNVRHSFIILLVTTLLFSFITVSNVIYHNKGETMECDLVINNLSYDGNYSTLNLDFVYALYDEERTGEIGIDYVVVERISNNAVLTREKSYTPDCIINLQKRKWLSLYEDKEKLSWCDKQFYLTILDEVQLEKLNSYIVEGKIEELSENTFICILSSGQNYTHIPSYECRVSYNTSIGIYPKNVTSLRSYVSGQKIKEQGYTVKTLAVFPRDPNKNYLPYDILKDLHLPLENSDYIMAQTCYELKEGNLFNGTEVIKIKLDNSSLMYEFQTKLDELILEYNANDLYKVDTSKTSKEVENFAIFLLNIFMYPLIGLLFMISIFNLRNTFEGNLIIKEQDIKIMKTVGIQYSQVKRMLWYEYLEGYINASFFVSSFFCIFALIISKFQINKLLDFTYQILGTILSSVLFIGPILVFPYILISFKKIKEGARV